MDEELGLLSGRYTPRLQATITRLGSKLPFREAAKEVGYSHRTSVAEATCRRVTYRSGQAAEALVQQVVEQLEAEGAEPIAAPEKLLISADGSFIHLTNGEWREVKSVAVGEFEARRPKPAEEEVKTRDISYFTRSYGARDFERHALAELHRRGLEQAETVVAVNDGAEWIQGFIDYHCPQAVRIIDFAHALSYIGDAGKAIWGEGTPAFESWFARSAHQLKHKPPQHTLADLNLLRPKAKNDEQDTVLDRTLFYLQKRREMIDYSYFRQRGYPIGSGSVESGHKVVVQRRLKGAGMRWAEHNVNPLLALRDLLCNGRWAEGWQDIVTQQQQMNMRRRVRAIQPPQSEPVTFSSLEATGQLSKLTAPVETQLTETKPQHPAKDHPWRRNIWPSKRSRRW